MPDITRLLFEYQGNQTTLIQALSPETVRANTLFSLSLQFQNYYSIDRELTLNTKTQTFGSNPMFPQDTESLLLYFLRIFFFNHYQTLFVKTHQLQ